MSFCRSLVRALTAACGVAGFLFVPAQLASGQAAPSITGQPQSTTVIGGSNAPFTATASGQATLDYRWYFAGAQIFNGGRVSGATTATLGISNVIAGDAGDYWVTVSNRHGLATSAMATLTVVFPPIITSQPVSQSAPVGSNASFTVTAGGTSPLAYQWRKDGVALADGGNVVGSATSNLNLANVSGADAGGYTVVVSNAYGTATSSVAVLTINLATVDAGFNPGADIVVYSMAVQPDGKILAGGYFTSLGGQPRSRIGRLNADGTVDPAFNPGADSYVFALAVQPDGNILAAGGFSSIGGQARNRIARLNPDGTLDAGFSSGVNDTVYALAVQPDGNILVGGRFTTLAGGARNAIGRLHADGTLDATFNPGADGLVTTVVLQPDGKILVGGDFNTVGGQPRRDIARLNADGSLDAGFNAGASLIIDCLALQPDGKILLAGRFWEVNGQPRSGLARLLPDGTLDLGFDPPVNAEVNSLTVQSDGKILVGGNFTMLAGEARSSIGRLNSDGTVDATFAPGSAPNIYALALQADGKILLGGNFGNVGGQPRNAIARLNNTLPATQSLSFDGTSITWLRSGSGPEVSRTAFHESSDNVNWTYLGDGKRIAGGWQLTNVTLAPGITIRAQGNATGGFRNGSTWLAESRIGPPIIIGQPASRTNESGTEATFQVQVVGNDPLSYQWRRNGLPLVNDGQLGGALTISNLHSIYEGAYDVVVTNIYGAVTSVVAILEVEDPVIKIQPTSRYVIPGRNTSFTVQAVGGDPVAYQWHFGGTPLTDDGHVTGATTPSLAIQNVQSSDAGTYWVTVSNAWGYVTSSIVTLNLATIRYVNVNNPSPVAPYTSWPTAATVIQDAIDAAGPGDEIQVTNGVYSQGGALGPYAAGNRVSLNKPLTVVSVNGPAVTTIIGYAAPLVSSSGQRCAYVSSGAVLAGFTLTQGRVEFTTSFYNKLGGGVWCDNGGVVSNCFILGNRAGEMGGGIMYGKAINCVIAGNYGKNYAGGAAHCELVNCTIVGNSSTSAGGTYWCTLKNSIVVSNSAGGTSFNWTGGGAFNSCTIPLPGGAGNLTNDPVFVDYPAGNYRLQFGSPCIDAGQDAFVAGNLDSDAHPRIVGPSVDMGAYEHQLAPWIYSSPTNQSAVVSSNASLVVVALGDGPLIYRWQKNGVNLADDGRITGTSSSVLSISTVNVTDGGSYQVFVTNSLGSATSSVATLTILGPPIISVQPVSRTAPAGTNVSFSVTASGLAALSYQWRFAQTELPGRTSAALSLTNIQAANAGDYDVVVTNIYGALTSSIATLTVLPAAPTIVTQAVSRVVSVGQNATFTLVARGTEPMTCQWQRDGTNLAGANAFTLNLTNVNAGFAGTYRAAVSNSVGFALSTNVTLVVSPVLVWGLTNAQQLTSAGTIPSSATNLIAIAAGKATDAGTPCFALRDDGTLLTWGGFASIPANTTNVVAIAAGGPGSRAGDNNLALLGNGNLVHWTIAGNRTLPPAIANGGFVAVAAGATHQLALRTDGTVLSWGSYASGPSILSATNVPLSASNVIALAAGTDVSLALRADGTVVVWGANLYLPQQIAAISNLANVTGISAAGFQVLGLDENGVAAGYAATNPGPQTTYYGAPPATATNLAAISAGLNHSLALRPDGTVFGWGNTNFGELNVPPIATNVVALAAGNRFSLALVRDPFAPPIPPRIGRPPFSRTVMAGQPAVFNALAIGGLPLTYRWLRNGVPVAGQTKPSLIFTNVLPGDAGDYQLVALNGFGSATSLVATVSVTIPQTLLKSAGGASNGFTFTFTSIAGVIYVVEYKNDLNATTWTELERRFGVGGVETVTDLTAGGAMRLYRVLALYAPSPKLGSVTAGGGTVNFNFPTVAAANYIVQFKTNLNQTGWLELSRQTSTGALVIVNDPTTNGPSRFYRVKVE